MILPFIIYLQGTFYWDLSHSLSISLICICLNDHDVYITPNIWRAWENNMTGAFLLLFAGMLLRHASKIWYHIKFKMIISCYFIPFLILILNSSDFINNGMLRRKPLQTFFLEHSYHVILPSPSFVWQLFNLRNVWT